MKYNMLVFSPSKPAGSVPGARHQWYDPHTTSTHGSDPCRHKPWISDIKGNVCLMLCIYVWMLYVSVCPAGKMHHITIIHRQQRSRFYGSPKMTSAGKRKMHGKIFACLCYTIWYLYVFDVFFLFTSLYFSYSFSFKWRIKVYTSVQRVSILYFLSKYWYMWLIVI